MPGVVMPVEEQIYLGDRDNYGLGLIEQRTLFRKIIDNVSVTCDELLDGKYQLEVKLVGLEPNELSAVAKYQLFLVQKKSG